MTDSKPVIVIDVDGVLLKWESNLPFFARDNGIRLKRILQNFTNGTHISFTEIFGINNDKLAQELANKYNLSSHGRYLSAFDDAIDNLYKLQDNYKLVVVTSFGSTAEHYSNRCRNLQPFFPNTFEEVICLDYSVTKTSVFKDIEENHGEIVGFIDDQVYNINAVKTYAKSYHNDTLLNNCVHINRYDTTADYNNMEQVVNHFLKLVQ